MITNFSPHMHFIKESEKYIVENFKGLPRPRDALCLRADAAEILLSLREKAHRTFLMSVGRVGGNRTPIGGFGDR